jgi:tetratricopeptide (TPR) repeat protein
MILRAVLFVSIVMAAVTAAAQYASPDPLDDTPGNRGFHSSIIGTVRDTNNQSLPGVLVELQDPASGRTVGSTYTNGNGGFELREVPRGRFEVIVRSGIYEARSRVELPGNNEVNLRIATASGDDNRAGSKSSVSLSQMKVPGNARKFFQKAMEAFRMSRLDDAFALVQKALGLYPDYAQALTLRGVMSMQRGDTRNAEPDLQKAVELDYSDDTGYVALASLYNAEGKFDNAVQVLDRGMSLHPHSWQALAEMARAQNGKHDYNGALKSLAKADSYASPTAAYLHLLRAQALVGIHNLPGAITEIQTYLAKEPTGTNADSARKMLVALGGSEPAEAKK